MADGRPSSSKKPPGLTKLITQPQPVQELKPSGDLDSHGTLTLIDGRTIDVNADELVEKRELGRGTFGVVYEMYHPATDTTMAVKRIRSTAESQKQLREDLAISEGVNACKYTVCFFGALFREGDVWICMELMSHSLDVLYKLIYNRLQLTIPEEVIGKTAFSVVSALNYMKIELHVIHRDVKPSNIVIGRDGQIKLCDFGISGRLIDSLAKTLGVGCKLYMSPERIDPANKDRKYDVRSDVWSVGITMVELAKGSHPYPPFKTMFDQLNAVVRGPAPSLPTDRGFSAEFHDFIRLCLCKEVMYRPKYDTLVHHPFLTKHAKVDFDVAAWYKDILDRAARLPPAEPQ